MLAAVAWREERTRDLWMTESPVDSDLPSRPDCRTTGACLPQRRSPASSPRCGAC